MRISGHVSGTGPLSLPPQLQRAAAQPAKTEAAQTPEQTEKTPQDENKSRAFNQTPMEEVRTTAFARDQKASLAAVQEIGRLMESNETEASTETESEEAVSESEAPEEAEETAETEETEAPEGEGEVEEAPEFEADEPEAEESEESGETGEDLLEQDESAGPEYEQPEIDLDGLLRAAAELKKKPTFALAESWTLFTAF